jgi:hypothetical protein
MTVKGTTGIWKWLDQSSHVHSWELHNHENYLEEQRRLEAGCIGEKYYLEEQRRLEAGCIGEKYYLEEQRRLEAGCIGEKYYLEPQCQGIECENREINNGTNR